MELIKTIKQAEAQAREIIEQAKAEAARQAEENRKNRIAALAEAEQARKKAIEAAVSAAQSQGLKEVEKLKVKAENQRRKLRDKVGSKMGGATARVIDYLRS